MARTKVKARKKGKKDGNTEMVDANNNTNDSKKTSKVKNSPKEETKKAPEEEPKKNQNKNKGKRKSDHDQNSPNKLPRTTCPEELHVGGLPTDAKEDDVRKMLEKNGQILQFIWKEAKTNEEGKLMQPIVFIRYATIEATDKALALNGENFNGCQLKIKPSQNGHHFECSKDIFVGSVPADVTEEDVKQLFSNIGNIVNILIFTTKKNTKGAVVRFEDHESAKRAMLIPNPKIRDCLVRLSYRTDKKSSLFISEAPAAITVEKIRELFLDCGGIKDIRIVDSKLMGLKNVYVDFVDAESAENAKKKCDGKILGSPVKIGLAMPPKDPKLIAKPPQ